MRQQQLDRLDDVEWMARTGETLPGAAARLGMTPTSLKTWLGRVKRADLIARLLANQGEVQGAGGRPRTARKEVAA